MNRRSGLFAVFASMLASLGGSMPAVALDTTKRNHSPKLGPNWTPLAENEGYVTTWRGYIRRRSPKRDKSMSGRQWKRWIKAERCAQAQMLAQTNDPLTKAA